MGLAAVGECVLSGGFRATVLIRPVGVIDVYVFVVAGVRATDTLVLRCHCLPKENSLTCLTTTRREQQ